MAGGHGWLEKTYLAVLFTGLLVADGGKKKRFDIRKVEMTMHPHVPLAVSVTALSFLDLFRRQPRLDAW